jgi:fido (protein-threonine AMPylation protein)
VTHLGPDPGGATPLDDDELDGLVPVHVTSRADLDAAEFDNIVAALGWARALARRSDPHDLLTYGFLLRLHARMFGDV